MMQEPHTFFEGIFVGEQIAGSANESQLSGLMIEGERAVLATSGDGGCALFTNYRLIVGEQAGLLSKRLRVKAISRTTIAAYTIDPDTTVTLELLGGVFGRARLIFDPDFDPMQLSQWLGETLVGNISKEES